MVRSYSYGAPLLLAGGFVASMVLVPNSRELATLLYQAGRYAEAEPVFAERYRAGEGGVHVLGPLVRMQLAKGDSEQALSLMEAYERTHPGDERLWVEALGEDADELPPAEQVRLLSALAERSPSVPVYEQLAALYQALGSPVDEAAALGRLIELEPQRLNARERLIRIHTEAGEFAAAGQVLDQLFLQSPDERTGALEEERLRLYLRAGQQAQADAWALARIGADATVAPHYAALSLSAGATTDLGEALSQGPANQGSTSVWAVDVVLGQAWQVGREDLLTPLLGRIAPTDPAYPLVRVAASQLGAGQGEAVIEGLASIDEASLTGRWQRLWLAYLSLSAGRVEEASRVLEGIAAWDDASTQRFAAVAPVVLKSGKLEQSAALYKRLNQRFPADAFAEAESILTDALAQRSAEAEAIARRQTELERLARQQAEPVRSGPIDSVREAELKLLAATEGPGGTRLAQLTGLWGRHAPEDALDWLQARARKAPAGERAGWWNLLVDLGGARRVLGLITREYYQLNDDQEAALLRAYEAVRIDVARDRQLLSQSWSMQDVWRLEHLAMTARQEGRERAEAGIWQRVLMLQPDHAEARRRLGQEVR